MKTDSRLQVVVLCLVLVVLTVATFGSALGHAFIALGDPSRLAGVGLIDSVASAAPTPRFEPFTDKAYAAVATTARRDAASADGLQAAPFHLANLLMHVVAVLLVFAILRELTGHAIASALGAGVFAIHPVMVESVAWIAAFDTLLGGAFALLAIWQYVIYAKMSSTDDTPVRARIWVHLAAATLAFLLAMLANPAGAVAVIVVSAVDLLLLGRPWKQVMPALALWVPLAVLLILVSLSSRATSGTSPTAWPMVAADAVGFAVLKVIAPINLAVDYGRSSAWLMRQPDRFVTWTIPLVLLALGWRMRGRAPVVLVAGIVFVAAVIAHAAITPNELAVYSFVSNRALYLAMLAPAALIAYAVARRPSRIVIAAGGVLVLGFVVRSLAQVPTWRNTLELYVHTLRVNPGSVVAHIGMGELMLEQDQTEQAINHYRAALNTRPTDAVANFRLGTLLLPAGKSGEALAHLRAAVLAAPNNPRYRAAFDAASTTQPAASTQP